MDLGDVVTAAGVVVAVSAAVFARRQATEERKSRRTAEEALVEAKEQTKLAVDANSNAWLALDAAKKAATASQGSADEARKANELTREQMTARDVRQEAAALAHARKVTMMKTRVGAEAVSVRNSAADTFHELTLEHVVCTTHSSWGWQLNPRRRGARSQYDTLPAQGKRDFGIEFLDDDGQPQPFTLFADLDYSATITYRDATWQLWRRTNDAVPEPIDG